MWAHFVHTSTREIYDTLGSAATVKGLMSMGPVDFNLYNMQHNS